MARVYRPEGLKLIASQIIVNTYRTWDPDRFTSDDLISDLQQHDDYEILTRYNSQFPRSGLLGVVNAVVRTLPFGGTGPWAGQLALRYVPVPGRRLHDICFADTMTAADWQARRTKQQNRLGRLQTLLQDEEAIIQELQSRGEGATLADIYGRMAVGF